MPLSKTLINQLIKSTQMAAYGASLYIGKKDKISADKAAVDRMRYQLNKIDMKGRIVIGEGELDDAPMLYIGEELGSGDGDSIDIAVDPVEGTNFVANNKPNAISVLAASEKNNMLHAPETYMNKIAIGPNLPKNLVDLDFDLEENLSLLAKAKGKKLIN
jgi:Fructose-1,6-bisphosphatase/sedoheptulose 1,7-bisphosphatase and related proteins